MQALRDGSAVCRHRKDCDAVCSAGIKMVILCAAIGGVVISGSAL